jgi:ribosome-binding factor A
MKTHRLARVTEVIREVASETILFGLKDPRVKNVTVTRAEVSGDLQHAKVYVSVMGTEAEQKLCLHGLKHAAGFVQSKLADRMQTRYTPTLTFILDPGVKNALEVSRLIKEALAADAPPADELAEDHSAEDPSAAPPTPHAEAADGSAADDPAGP